MLPAIGSGGLAGWRLLQRNADRQLQALARDPQVARERSRFEEGAARHGTAEALVGDWQMLKVALTAFGLEADLPNKAFIRKVLESDLTDPKSLANRLSDKRYRSFAEALGLGAGAPTPNPGIVAKRVSGLYLERELERRIGEADPDLRLALNARRELGVIAARSSGERTKWFEVMGTPPLRQLMESALGLSRETIRLSIDRQAELFAETAARRFGMNSFGDLQSPGTLARIIDSFLARASIDTMAAGSPYSSALTILRAR